LHLHSYTPATKNLQNKERKEAMKYWKSAFLTLSAFALLIFTGPDIPSYAKGGSSSGGSRSSSFGSSSSSKSSGSGGYSKPSLGGSYSRTTTTVWGSRSGGGVVKTTTSSGYSKPAVATSGGYSKPISTTSKPVVATTLSSGGYSKPLSSGQTTNAPPKTSSGYTKPATATTTAPVPQKVNFSAAGKSNFDKGATKELQKKNAATSLATYKAETSKFKQPEKPFDKGQYTNNGLYKSAPVYSGYNAQRQITVRNNYYTTHQYTPPSYYTNFGPSYGVFDTMFMFWMMDSMHHNAEARAMAHNYQNDPGYRQWRADAEKQAATNAELKEKLAKMDSELATMKSQPVNPNYVPKDIPSEAIVAPQAMMAKTPAKAPFKFATGQTTGRYHMFGETLKTNATHLAVSVLTTAGSMENLKLLVEGKADAAVVQSDTLAMFSTEFPGQHLATEQSVLYPEFMQLIVNSGSGIKSINDMLDGKIEICFPKGSGSSLSWKALCEQDAKYKKIPVRYITSNDACLIEVSKNPKLALFLVSGLNSPVLRKAEKMASDTGTLRLATVDDTHMLDKTDTHGNKVYTYYTIPKDTYPTLQKSWWFFKRDVATLGVDAVLVLRTAWVEQYGSEALDALTMSVMETRTDVDRSLLAKK
jgi:TRAP transporter TAXI family solute receptor